MSEFPEAANKTLSAAPAELESSAPGMESPAIGIVPFSASKVPSMSRHASLTLLVNDERAITRLLETMLAKAGLTVGQAAKILGVTDESVRQYIMGRRANPTLKWLLRFSEMCGARITVEFPK